MKRVARITGILLCVLIFFSVFSVPFTTIVTAQPAIEWVARWSGYLSGFDDGDDIVLGQSGNVYVTGIGHWTGYLGDDYTTISYDPSGNERWVARYDGPGGKMDWAQDIATDSSETIYVTGLSVGTGTSVDYATIAYDSSGNELWVARYDGPSSLKDFGWALALDASSNVYVTGQSDDEFEVGDYATVAYDSSGNERWVARYDGPSSLNDEAHDIATDLFGNVYVTGRSNTHETATDWESDWVTIAYDSSGNELWVARYDGPASEYDDAFALTTDLLGNVYVTGCSTGSGTRSDITTIAYDSSGNELWVARYDGPASLEDTAYSIILDSSGNVYVTGFGDMGGQNRYSDFVTIAYDSSGNELWVETYDGHGEGNDISRSIEVGPFGNIYITGVSGGKETGYDSVTIAYDSTGKELWVARYDGGVGNDDSTEGIAVDSYGNIYVTGYSRCNDTGADIITIKYASGHLPEPTLNIDPDTLNLKSKGRWITAYIELYDGRDVRDIDISTIVLNETIPAERWPTAIGDYDEDGVPDLMVKFNRSRVQEYIEGLNLSPGGAGIFGYYVTLTVTGSFNDGTTFECSDTIRVLVAERMGVGPSPFLFRAYVGMINLNPMPTDSQRRVVTTIPALLVTDQPFAIAIYRIPYPTADSNITQQNTSIARVL